MVSLSFSSCNKDKDRKVSNSERLIGEWIYRTTQEKTNGEWKDMPTQVGAEGMQTFYKDGKALITMTFKGEYMEQKFEWNLKDNKYYIHNQCAKLAKFLNICKPVAGNLINNENIPRRAIL